MPAETDVKGYSHKLGGCGITFFATKKLAARYGASFPNGLDGAPLLVPSEGTAVRGRLMRWLGAHRIQPRIVGEFDDSALLKTFGASGLGVFPAVALVHDDLVARYGVRRIGACEGVEEHFYAIGTEKKVRHPLVERLLPRRS